MWRPKTALIMAVDRSVEGTAVNKVITAILRESVVPGGVDHTNAFIEAVILRHISTALFGYHYSTRSRQIYRLTV